MANEAKDTDDFEKYGARPKKRISQQIQRYGTNHPETPYVDLSAISGDKCMSYDNEELSCDFPDKTELNLEESEKSAIDGHQTPVYDYSYIDNATSAVMNVSKNIFEDQANENRNEKCLDVTTVHFTKETVHIEKNFRQFYDKVHQEVIVVARRVIDLNHDNEKKLKIIEQTTNKCLQVLENSFEDNTDAFKQELLVHYQKSVGHFQEQLKETFQQLMQQMPQKIKIQTDDREFQRTFCEFKADVVELSIERYNSLPFSPFGKEKTVDFFELYVIPSLFRKRPPYSRNAQEKRIESEQLKTLQDIFEVSSTKTKKVFISGKSGYGKSSFCKFLLLSWCLEQPQTGIHERDKPLLELKRVAETRQDLTEFSAGSNLKHRFEVVFLLNIRCLQRPVCYIEEMIKIQVTERLSGNFSKKFFEKVMRDHTTLVIVDGLDEWFHDPSCKEDHAWPQTQKIRRNCTVLFTSNSWKLRELNVYENQANIIDLEGLCNAANDSLVSNFTTCLNYRYGKNKKYKNCQTFLESSAKKMFQHSREQRVFSVPIILSYLICIWHDNDENTDVLSILKSRSEVYCKIIKLMIMRSQCADCKLSPGSETCLPECFRQANCWFCKDCQKIIVALGKLSFNSYANEKQKFVINVQTVHRYLLHEQKEVVLKIGFLTGTHEPQKAVENDELFCFQHDSFKEMFCAVFLSSVSEEIWQECLHTIADSIERNDMAFTLSDAFVFLCTMHLKRACELSHLISISKVWDLPDEATVENVFKKRAMVASIQEIVLKGYDEAFGEIETTSGIQFRHVSIRSVGGVKLEHSLIRENMGNLISIYNAMNCDTDINKVLRLSSSFLKHLLFENNSRVLEAKSISKMQNLTHLFIIRCTVSEKLFFASQNSVRVLCLVDAQCNDGVDFSAALNLRNVIVELTDLETGIDLSMAGRLQRLEVTKSNCNRVHVRPDVLSECSIVGKLSKKKTDLYIQSGFRKLEGIKLTNVAVKGEINLATCENLREIFFSNIDLPHLLLKNTNVVGVTLENVMVMGCIELTKCLNMSTLSISGASNLRNVIVQECPKLLEVSISKAKIKESLYLSECPGIIILKLNGVDIDNELNMSKVSVIKHVDVSGCKINRTRCAANFLDVESVCLRGSNYEIYTPFLDAITYSDISVLKVEGLDRTLTNQLMTAIINMPTLRKLELTAVELGQLSDDVRKKLNTLQKTEFYNMTIEGDTYLWIMDKLAPKIPPGNFIMDNCTVSKKRETQI